MLYRAGNDPGSSGGTGRWPGTLITTPIAYITSIPIDLYNTALQRRVAGRDGSAYAKPGYAWSYQYSYEPLGFESPGWSGWVVSEMHFPFRPKWVLESAGPDGTWWELDGLNRLPARFYYDPTNGTVSQGQLCYSDKGFITPRNK